MMMGLSLGRFPVSALRQRGAGLNFAALPAMPASRSPAVTAAANAAAATLGVSAQSIVDALAVGRGVASMLPNDGCLLASSGGSPTAHGDPVGAIRSWTGVELATQGNASLRPVSAASGLFADGSKRMELGSLSAWTTGEAFTITALDAAATLFNQSGFWDTGTSTQISYVPIADSALNGQIFSTFGIANRFTSTAGFVLPITKKIITNHRHTGTNLIIDVGISNAINAVAAPAFRSSAVMLSSTASTFYLGTWSALALNQSLYTTAQRAAVREFCRNYYGVIY